MKQIEVPSADVIRKFARGGAPGPVPVEKNGVPVDAGDPTAGTKLTSQWMDITPSLAAAWLKNNFRNRPMKEDVITAYARDMIRGVWQPTHQGVAFNDLDQLIDGQHRLAAIVKSRRTIRMMVTFGLPSKINGHEMTVMDCVDRGCTRTVADQLKIQHGLKTGTQIAQMATALAHLCVGEKMRRLSVGQTLEIYRAFERSADLVIANRSREHGLRSVGVLAGFVFVLAANEEDVCGPVYKLLLALNSGEGIDRWPMLGKLRAFLTGEQARLVLASLNKGIAELVVQVLCSEIANEQAVNLEMRPEEWLKAVVQIRERQPARVEKIAALFRLPTVAATPPSPAVKLPRVEPLGMLPGAKPGERRFTCECSATYFAVRRTGCPVCQKRNLLAEKKHAGVRNASREYALDEQV